MRRFLLLAVLASTLLIALPGSTPALAGSTPVSVGGNVSLLSVRCMQLPGIGASMPLLLGRIRLALSLGLPTVSAPVGGSNPEACRLPLEYVLDSWIDDLIDADILTKAR